MSQKQRLDKLLVERGLISSRQRAQGLILAGQVLVNDRVVDKVGAGVALEDEVRIKGEPLPYVSRGGLKLAAALDTFAVDVKDCIAIDVGASTGGFTDCLLQRGARKVYAVDVGYGQLAWSLRQDARVINLERTNIRELSADALEEKPDLAVIDASFISLEKVLPPTLALLAPAAHLVALIKPQFEVGKGQVGKGGVVRDPNRHEAVIEKISQFAHSLGCAVKGVCPSPILGPKGNREFLIYLQVGAVPNDAGSGDLAKAPNPVESD
jgi:23S rRNA (cytidine1920-2'-O)/16S rRNA (cytidine1409-2'-O)-methyltransferase